MSHFPLLLGPDNDHSSLYDFMHLTTLDTSYMWNSAGLAFLYPVYFPENTALKDQWKNCNENFLFM